MQALSRPGLPTRASGTFCLCLPPVPPPGADLSLAPCPLPSLSPNPRALSLAVRGAPTDPAGAVGIRGRQGRDQLTPHPASWAFCGLPDPGLWQEFPPASARPSPASSGLAPLLHEDLSLSDPLGANSTLSPTCTLRPGLSTSVSTWSYRQSPAHPGSPPCQHHPPITHPRIHLSCRDHVPISHGSTDLFPSLIYPSIDDISFIYQSSPISPSNTATYHLYHLCIDHYLNARTQVHCKN